MQWKTPDWETDTLLVLLARIQQKKQQLDALRPMSTSALKRLGSELSMEWTYHSNAIEGNTLSLQETRMVVQDGLTVRGKSLREHFEVTNHQHAIAWIEKLADRKENLSENHLLEVHRIILQGIDQEFGGRYRNGAVRITGANFVPPNALKVPEYVADLLDWCQRQSDHLPPPVVSAIFHHRLVWIHPFFDGNGRTARLLSSLLLIRAGYPPAIILKNDRKKYYEALNQANQGDYGKVLLLVFQALERTLDIYLSHLNNNYEDFQSITDIVSAPDFPYGQEYISLLARQGKIAAFKEKRNWLTSKKAITEYLAHRQRQSSPRTKKQP